MRNSTKTIFILGVSFLLVAAEAWLKGRVPVSGLLAVVSMACVLRVKTAAFASRRLAEKLGKLWICAEVTLFVLVGAAVDVRFALKAGAAAAAMIFLALAFRSLGVLLCLAGTPLGAKSACSASSPICPRRPCRPPSAPCRWPWACPAGRWCWQWRCSPS